MENKSLSCQVVFLWERNLWAQLSLWIVLCGSYLNIFHLNRQNRILTTLSDNLIFFFYPFGKWNGESKWFKAMTLPIRTYCESFLVCNYRLLARKWVNVDSCSHEKSDYNGFEKNICNLFWLVPIKRSQRINFIKLKTFYTKCYELNYRLFY